jgi:cell fate regulator YaaT (PSP1 superfamily)
MAKDQQLALNPSKISGNCGRLLCCLRYETDMYIELFKQFPPLGSKVKINSKQGMINYINIFQNKGLVYFEDGSQEWLTPEDFQKGTFEHAAPQA